MGLLPHLLVCLHVFRLWSSDTAGASVFGDSFRTFHLNVDLRGLEFRVPSDRGLSVTVVNFHLELNLRLYLEPTFLGT